MSKPYRLPQGYMKWSRFADHCEKISFLSPQKPTELKTSHVGEHFAYLSQEWSHGYPVYCVRKSLIDDMLETDVGENTDMFSNINMSVPTYLLCFPKSTIKSPAGSGFIDYLIVDIVESDIKCNDKGERSPYKYLIFWGGFDSNDVLMFSGKGIYWGDGDETAKPSALLCSEMEKDRAFLIRNIVLQTILLLQYYPKIQQEVTSLSKSESKGFGGNAKPIDYRLPRWLGNEKKDTEYNENEESKNPTEGSRKSKHYRGWHWRLQPCGEGRKDIKPVRVRGAWINPDFEK